MKEKFIAENEEILNFNMNYKMNLYKLKLIKEWLLMGDSVLLYEGKAKKMYSTDNKDEIRVYYKDDATAFNGLKKAQIEKKGILNNSITTMLFELLEKKGIKTHFIKKLSDREQLCKKVEIVPLEVIVRNVAAGSMAKRYGIAEGTKLKNNSF